MPNLPYAWPLIATLIFLAVAALLVFARVVFSRWPEGFITEIVMFVLSLAGTLAALADPPQGTRSSAQALAVVGLIFSAALLWTCIIPNRTLRKGLRGTRFWTKSVIISGHLTLTLFGVAWVIYACRVMARTNFFNPDPAWESGLNEAEGWLLLVGVISFVLFATLAVITVVKHYSSRKAAA